MSKQALRKNTPVTMAWGASAALAGIILGLLVDSGTPIVIGLGICVYVIIKMGKRVESDQDNVRRQTTIPSKQSEEKHSHYISLPVPLANSLSAKEVDDRLTIMLDWLLSIEYSLESKHSIKRVGDLMDDIRRVLGGVRRVAKKRQHLPLNGAVNVWPEQTFTKMRGLVFVSFYRNEDIDVLRRFNGMVKRDWGVDLMAYIEESCGHMRGKGAKRSKKPKTSRARSRLHQPS